MGLSVVTAELLVVLVDVVVGVVVVVTVVLVVVVLVVVVGVRVVVVVVVVGAAVVVVLGRTAQGKTIYKLLAHGLLLSADKHTQQQCFTFSVFVLCVLEYNT